MKVEGTVALVTGGGTGIGRAVCQSIAQAGARAVAVNYSRSRQEAEETAAELAKSGCDAWAIQADVGDEKAVKKMVAEVVSRHDRLDILVNNAGTTRFIDLPDLDALGEDVWDAILDVNLMGSFWCSREAAPHLKKARGCIVNVGSIAGFRGAGSSLPYGVSKAAITQLSRNLAVALAPEVRVNTVSPGQVVSRWWRIGKGEEVAEQVEAASAAKTPLGRNATPEDVAQAVMAFIDMDMVTGQYLLVDGGRSVTY